MRDPAPGRMTRPGPPRLPAELVGPAPAIPTALEELKLTPGQAAFLAGLTPRERAWLDRWPKTRAMLLRWHTRGSDPIIAAEVARLLAGHKVKLPRRRRRRAKGAAGRKGGGPR